MMTSGRFSLVRPRLLAAGLCTLVAACSREEPAPAPAPAAPEAATAPESATPTARSYTVRGEIVSLPEAGNPRAELRIKHEAIDDFRNREDVVVGMNSMTMAFPVGEGASLEGLAVGDKVEFVFEVQMPGYRVTRITELPADTVLEFGKANPPGN